MRAAFILIACVILVVMGGVFMLGLTDFRSREYTDYRDVATTYDQFTANVTLTLPLLDNEISWVTITSNITEDVPYPVIYYENNHTLTVGGLMETESRRLTINYRFCQLTGAYYTIADVIARVAPAMFILGIIGLAVIAVYSFWPGRRGPPE